MQTFGDLTNMELRRIAAEAYENPGGAATAKAVLQKRAAANRFGLRPDLYEADARFLDAEITSVEQVYEHSRRHPRLWDGKPGTTRFLLREVSDDVRQS